MNRLSLLLLSILGPVWLSGCGGGAVSARGVAEAYLGYMKSGKYLEAAKLWDYETQARRDNEDWDSIVESQRTLIIDKLAQEKAESLKLWATYFPATTRIVAFQESGEAAHASLEGGKIEGFDLKLVGENWRISGM